MILGIQNTWRYLTSNSHCRNYANSSKRNYQGLSIKVKWSMSNSEIMKRINEALFDKEKTNGNGNRVRQRYFDANMDMANYTVKLNKIFEDVLKMKTYIFYHLYITDTPVYKIFLKVQFDSIVDTVDCMKTIYFGVVYNNESDLLRLNEFVKKQIK